MKNAWSFNRLLHLRCPRCGADSFRAGWFKTAKACSSCGLVFEREAGFYAGAIYPFYGGAVLLGAVGLLFSLFALGWSFERGMAVGGALVLLASPWLFWYSRLAFLNTDHRFFKEGD